MMYRAPRLWVDPRLKNVTAFAKRLIYLHGLSHILPQSEVRKDAIALPKVMAGSDSRYSLLMSKDLYCVKAMVL